MGKIQDELEAQVAPENQFQGPGLPARSDAVMRRINTQISTPIPGASSINKVWVEVNGVETTQMLSGTQFVLKANATLVNTGGGRWGACLAWKETSHGIMAGYKLIAAMTLGGTTMNTGDTVIGTYTMPTYDMTIQMKGFMCENDTPTVPPAGYGG